MPATTHAPFAPRWDFGIAVFDDKIWVIGGSEGGTTHNDVWYSSDGITWNEATPQAGFSPRMEPSAVVYNEKLWVTGGFDWAGEYNDVWNSPDGITWTQVTPHAPFAPRRYQGMESANGKMWVIGGYDGANPLNDVWFSADGFSWTRTPMNDSFPPRYGFTTAVFDNKLWVIAGTTGNDVWYSEGFDPASQDSNSPGSSSGSPMNKASGILVTKKISPVSLKQGTDAKITITIFNRGPGPVHDIEILDSTVPEFPVVKGITQYATQSIEPSDTRILTYTVHAMKPGSFKLNKTAVMYADPDGNYHITYSNIEKVEVFAPLIATKAEAKSDDLFQNIFTWIKGPGPSV